MEKVWTISQILDETRKYFSAKGIDSARLDAEILLAHVLHVDRIRLYTDYDRPLVASELSCYREFVKRRAKREPVAYITGEKEFWSIDFQVNADVLIPRPDTEILVETALEIFKADFSNRSVSVLEIGTGSGAISVSLARDWPAANFITTDISYCAVTVAQKNIFEYNLQNRIRLVCADGLSAFGRKSLFDVIVSNPPYIPTGSISGLQPEITMFEPGSALDGGMDGLDFYRKTLKSGYVNLKKGGYVILEIGSGQGEAIYRLFSESGIFSQVQIRKDYSDQDRVLIARKN